MNERLKELDKQAVDYALSVCDANGVYQGKEYLSVVKERFAELIVRECVKVVDDMADPEDSDRYFWAIQNASNNIRKHFGVEE